MFTVEDLKIMISIIDASSKNGLFRPSDFQIVGELYKKIMTEISNQTSQTPE